MQEAIALIDAVFITLFLFTGMPALVVAWHIRRINRHWSVMLFVFAVLMPMGLWVHLRAEVPKAIGKESHDSFVEGQRWVFEKAYIDTQDDGHPTSNTVVTIGGLQQTFSRDKNGNGTVLSEPVAALESYPKQKNRLMKDWVVDENIEPKVEQKVVDEKDAPHSLE